MRKLNNYHDVWTTEECATRSEVLRKLAKKAAKEERKGHFILTSEVQNLMEACTYFGILVVDRTP